MKGFKIFLWPLAVIYDAITRCRNILYDVGIIKSQQFDRPLIVVGNLAVGGTGKSPMVMNIIEQLLPEHSVAMISRGYGRKTHGYIRANAQSTALDVGDEPLQLYHRFKGKIPVSVCESRVVGVQNLLQEHPDLDALVLDDAYQHRAVKPSVLILLTIYNNLYTQDWLMPMGCLRESARYAQRADVIVVTKCPNELNPEQKQNTIHQLNPLPHQLVVFSTVQYVPYWVGHNGQQSLLNLPEAVLVVTGIAHPQAFVEQIKQKVAKVEHKAFADHFNFKSSDISDMIKLMKFKNLSHIITTEKDYMRLKQFDELLPFLYHWPIEIKLDNPEAFHHTIHQKIKVSHQCIEPHKSNARQKLTEKN